MIDEHATERSRIDAFLQTSMESWIALFRALIAERSVFEAEHGVVDLVAKRVSACGMSVTRVEHRRARLEQLTGACRPFSDVPGRASLVARVPGSGGGRSLALSTHLDVVPSGDETRWTYPPFAATIDGHRNIIYGRGAADDRAGVVIAVAILETLVRLRIPLAGDVLFHFVLENETTGNGTLLCLQAGHRADAAIIIDGTRPDRAITSHAGQLQFDVVAHGSPSAVSVSHVGVNAVEILCELLLDLRREIFALNDGRPEAWRVYPSPFQFVTQGMAADVVTLTVPDTARATCYVTFPPPTALAEMRARLERWTRAFADRRRLAGRYELVWSGFAAEPVEPNDRDVGLVVRRVAEKLGMVPPALVPSTGPSDLRHFVNAGIPGLLYGPGRGHNPHRPDEHYELDDLPLMIRFFVEFAAAWCGCAKA
jgi:acetylornithine deacetylase